MERPRVQGSTLDLHLLPRRNGCGCMATSASLHAQSMFSRPCLIVECIIRTLGHEQQMCWSGEACAVIAATGIGLTVYTWRKGERAPLCAALAYFAGMEALQAVTYI